MDYTFDWRIDSSEHDKKFTEETTSSYIEENPDKLKPCHDDPMLIALVETVADGEMVLGDIYCSCGVRVGLLRCVPDTDNFKITTPEDL